MAVRTIVKVIRTFDGVEGISAEQKEGIVNYIQRKGQSCGPAMENHWSSLLFQLLPGICSV